MINLWPKWKLFPCWKNYAKSKISQCYVHCSWNDRWKEWNELKTLGRPLRDVSSSPFFFFSSFFNNTKVQYCVQKLLILVLAFSTFSIKCPKLLILMWSLKEVFRTPSSMNLCYFILYLQVWTLPSQSHPSPLVLSVRMDTLYIPLPSPFSFPFFTPISPGSLIMLP